MSQHPNTNDGEGAVGIRAVPYRFPRADKTAVRELLMNVALIPAERWAYSYYVGSLDRIAAGRVVGKVLESDATMLATWQTTTTDFRDDSTAAIAALICGLESTVSGIIDRFPGTTEESEGLCREAVATACDACYATIRTLLDDHVRSPGYQGDRSWETMEEAVVAKAEAGDRAAQVYVERHEHLPEYPGKPLWNGTEWTDYTEEFFEWLESDWNKHLRNAVMSDIVEHHDEVCRILNGDVGPDWPPDRSCPCQVHASSGPERFERDDL
jgi:hypothetical protein